MTIVSLCHPKIISTFEGIFIFQAQSHYLLPRDNHIPTYPQDTLDNLTHYVKILLALDKKES